MRRLTILTEHYEKIIHAYLHGGAGEWIVRSEGHRDKNYYAQISYRPGGRFAETLTAALEESAAWGNPAYLEFPDLVKIARDLRGTPINRENQQRLSEFLAANGALHIEGYTAFRMAEYNNRLDLISYGFIKQLLNRKLRATEN